VADTSHYRDLFASHISFKDKTVLDLGCNRGYLLHSFSQHESFSGIGADLVPYYLKDARRDYGHQFQFIQTTSTTIPLPNSSVDVVYTIDTIAPLSNPRAGCEEGYPVLRPDGLFLVHFNPWLYPHGSHLEDIIPFPWAHVVFSMDTLLAAAAKLYDSPHYETACYYLDANGNKKPETEMNLAQKPVGHFYFGTERSESRKGSRSNQLA